MTIEQVFGLLVFIVALAVVLLCVFAGMSRINRFDEDEPETIIAKPVEEVGDMVDVRAVINRYKGE